MLFPILLETDAWLVINKPAGADFHSQSGNAGLIVQLSSQLNQPLWPVHRLDKVTSGCLLVAKSAEAAATLSRQFADRHVQKTYIALACGKPRKKQGWIKGDMVKSRNGSWKLSRQVNNPAITQFHSCAITGDIPALLSHYTGLRAYYLLPTTGKSHQLRVAMKSLGTPILGDSRYGGSPANRCYLHAYQLIFNWENETIQVNARLDPKYWPVTVLDALTGQSD